MSEPLVLTNVEPAKARRRRRKKKRKTPPPAPVPTHQMVKVFTREIHGILFFVDAAYNVYDPHEVSEKADNPTIIATCKEKEDKTLEFDQILCPDRIYPL
jgi:hypothetical protein